MPSHASTSGWSRWVKPEVYPLYAAVGIGIVAAGTLITRKLTSDPAVTAFRSQRGRELDPDKDKAAQYHDNALRKFVSGRKIGILPDPGSHHKHADHGSSH